MARKVTDITIDIQGRDFGKKYRLTEMPASQSEKWAARALLALVQSGADVPEKATRAGLAGLAAVGVKLLLDVPWDLLEPLLDEMWQCVQIVVEPIRAGGNPIVRQLVEEDIEEVTTRVKLRLDILELHLGFSLADKLSPSTALSAAQE